MTVRASTVSPTVVVPAVHPACTGAVVLGSFCAVVLAPCTAVLRGGDGTDLVYWPWSLAFVLPR
eukprot:1480654-Rhodomonas_salina.1